MLIRLAIDLSKDSYDLQDQTLDQKFGILVGQLNEAAYVGNGEVIFVDKRSFNLYEHGSNQIISFHYSTGHLTVTWKYKYLQKEIVHGRTFEDVRNISVFEQTRMAEQLLEEMHDIVYKHQEAVLEEHFDFTDADPNEIEAARALFSGNVFEYVRLRALTEERRTEDEISVADIIFGPEDEQDAFEPIFIDSVSPVVREKDGKSVLDNNGNPCAYFTVGFGAPLQRVRYRNLWGRVLDDGTIAWERLTPEQAAEMRKNRTNLADYGVRLVAREIVPFTPEGSKDEIDTARLLIFPDETDATALRRLYGRGARFR